MIEVGLVWIFRVVVAMMVLRFVVGLFGRRPPVARSPWSGPGRASETRPERAGGTLVRDPQCGTYLPESRAVRSGSGAHTQFFCSTTCRDAYAASQSSVAS